MNRCVRFPGSAYAKATEPGVTAQGDDVEPRPTHRDHVAVPEPDRRSHRQCVGILLAGRTGRRQSLEQGRQRPGVVPVLVRRHDEVEPPAALGHEASEAVHVVGRVDQGCSPVAAQVSR